MDPDGVFESVLQRSWDRELSRKPVLLILVGSDLSMMEALTSYGRPFHQRGTQLNVGPLNPADVAAMAGLSAAEAFDAALVTGGRDRQRRTDLHQHRPCRRVHRPFHADP